MKTIELFNGDEVQVEDRFAAFKAEFAEYKRRPAATGADRALFILLCDRCPKETADHINNCTQDYFHKGFRQIDPLPPGGLNSIAWLLLDDGAKLIWKALGRAYQHFPIPNPQAQDYPTEPEPKARKEGSQ